MVMFFAFLVLFCSPFSEHVMQANDVYESMEARRWDDLVIYSAFFTCLLWFVFLLSYLIAPVV